VSEWDPYPPNFRGYGILLILPSGKNPD